MAAHTARKSTLLRSMVIARYWLFSCRDECSPILGSQHVDAVVLHVLMAFSCVREALYVSFLSV